jgi:hypothetical protein
MMFSPCYSLQIYLCGPSVSVGEKSEKNLADLLLLTGKLVPDESERTLR